MKLLHIDDTRYWGPSRRFPENPPSSKDNLLQGRQSCAVTMVITMNTNSPFSEKIIKSSRTFLSRWNGGLAEMWELTISHKTLRVLIRREDKPGNLLISCIDPVMIRGQVRWVNCDLRVTTLPGSRDARFLVADDSAGLEITCGALEMEENVKLW
jgi:hypothetical protein